jgi:acetyl esterase/lipase
LCRLVCGAIGAKVISVLYRLYVCQKNEMMTLPTNDSAPEHKFPIPLDDSYDAFKWVCAFTFLEFLLFSLFSIFSSKCLANAKKLKIDTNKIIIGGSSAGGNLTAALALKARDDEIKGIIGQILRSPITCHPKQFPAPTKTVKFTSYKENSDAVIVSADNMFYFWDAYYPEAGRDPLASPLLAESHAGLPQACNKHSLNDVHIFLWLTRQDVSVGGADPLRDEALAYADRLKQDGYCGLDQTPY